MIRKFSYDHRRFLKRDVLMLKSNLSIALFLLLSLISCDGGAVRGKTYKIAVDSSWYPANTQGKSQNIMGFFDDIIKEIAYRQKCTLLKDTLSSEGCFWGLNSENYDLVLSAKLPQSPPLGRYDFSENFLPLSPVLVVKQDADIHSLEAMNGKILGVYPDSRALRVLEKNTEIIYRYYNEIASAPEDVISHRIDGVILGMIQAKAYTKNYYRGKLRVILDTLTEDGIRFLALKDKKKELIEALNQVLLDIKKDKTYEALLEKWNIY